MADDDLFGYAPTRDPDFLKSIGFWIDDIEYASARGDRASVDAILGEMQGRIDQFTKKELADTFRESYKAGGGGTLTKQASARSLTIRKRVARNAQSALNDISVWATESAKLEELFKARTKTRKIQEQALQTINAGAKGKQLAEAQKLYESASSGYEKVTKDIERRQASLGNEPEVLYRRRRKAKGGARGTIAARRPAKEYFEMLERTAHKEASNEAYVLGARNAGVEWLMVSDGPECGWTSHRDSEKANGKVVRVEDIIMLAHPNCRRMFQTLPGGPNSKKAKELLERLTGMDRQDLGKVVKAATVAGYAFRTGQAIYQSPLTMRIVRSVVEDAEIALSGNLKKILADWSNIYDRNESLAAVARGWEDNVASRAQVRGETTDSLARKLEKNFDGSLSKKVTLSGQERQVLGLKNSNVSMGELSSRYADYLDFVRHDQDRLAPVIRSVGAAGQDENVIRELYGRNYVFHTATRFRRGSELLTNYKRGIAAVDKAMTGIDDVTGINNAVLAQVDIVRAAARVIDPFPWLKATANIPGGALRFSVGMTSDGRQDLAQSLYLKMRGQEYRAQFNRVYQQNHLGQVMKADITIRPQDIYEALLPRVSFLGKNMLNATIYAEGGKIIPVVHILPGNAYMRQLSLRMRLRSGAVESFVTDYREWGGDLKSYLAYKLNELPEDMIWTIEAFRNGPITANMRLTSDGLDSYGIKFRPRNEKIRATYKAFVRDPEEALDAIKEIVVIPRAWGGYTLDPYEMEKLELIVGLATMRKGALAEVARVVGIEYHRLLAVLDVHTRKYGERIGYLADKIREFRGAEVEYGVTALRLEEVRLRGKQVLDNALGKVEPRIVHVYDLVNKKYEVIAEGFDPRRHKMVMRGDKVVTFVSTKVDDWKPKVIYRYHDAQRKVETAMEGLDDVAKRTSSVDDFVKEADKAGGRHLRLLDEVGQREYSDDHFSFKRIYDRIINDEEIDLDTIEDIIEDRFPNIKFLLDKVSAEAFVSEAGVQTLVDISRVVDFMERRGVLKADILENFPKIKFAGADDLGDRGAGMYAYFENEILMRREFFGTADGRNLMTQHLMDDWASGWHPATGDTAHTFVHEFGHYITLDRLNTEQKMRLWNKFIDEVPAIRAVAPVDEALSKFSPGIIEDVRSGLVSYYQEVKGRMVDYHIFHHDVKRFFEAEWFNDVREHMIGPEVSYYAMQDWAEFLAETFTQMMYGPDTNDFTRVMYAFLKEEGVFP